MSKTPGNIVASSSQLNVVAITSQEGEALPWQRCLVADRVLVVLEGSGFCYGTVGREGTREELGSGDVLQIPRMTWHRIAARGEKKLFAILVTHEPSDVEYRT